MESKSTLPLVGLMRVQLCNLRQTSTSSIRLYSVNIAF